MAELLLYNESAAASHAINPVPVFSAWSSVLKVAVCNPELEALPTPRR
ncbi:hypothetical protein [Chitinophaga sp. OAE865]